MMTLMIRQRTPDGKQHTKFHEFDGEFTDEDLPDGVRLCFSTRGTPHQVDVLDGSIAYVISDGSTVSTINPVTHRQSRERNSALRAAIGDRARR